MGTRVHSTNKILIESAVDKGQGPAFRQNFLLDTKKDD